MVRGRGRGGLKKAILVSLCALGVGLLAVAPAIAAETHLFEASFGPDGTALSSFGQSAALAVDQSSGALYVADFTAQTVQKFNSAHEPEAFTGISPNIVGGKLTGFLFNTGEPLNQLAVNSTSHDLYVVDNTSNRPLKAYQSNGEPANFTAGPGAGTNEIAGSELCGVAVDASGDIYVSEAKEVQIYAPTGAPLIKISATEACNLAVDSHGIVYLTFFKGRVERFIPNKGGFPVTTSTIYEAGGTVDANASRSITVNPSTNHVYVDEGTRVAEYEEAGKETGSFGTAELGALTASEGVAVNGASGHVYVSDAKGKRQVEVFGPGIVLPDVATGEATNLTSASGQALLNGAVNPDAIAVTSCVFEYGSTISYGSLAPCSPDSGSGSAEVPVTASLVGLMPAGTYHYRLVAANANGRNAGQDRTFVAPGVTIDSQWVTEVTATSATLNAQINPNKSNITYRFEYGLTASYGHIVPIPDGHAVSGNGEVTVSEHVQELLPGTSYHYRLVAAGVGTAMSPDHTLLTQATGGEPALPDNRTWELVSPPDKHAAQIEPIKEFGVIQASAAGDGITYLATAPTENEPQGNALEVQVLSTRGSRGWTSHDIAPSHDAASGAIGTEEYQFFSDDLSLSVASPIGPFNASLSPEASEQTVYLRTDYLNGNVNESCVPIRSGPVGSPPIMTQCYRPLVTGQPGYANVREGIVFGKHLIFVGSTPDLSRVVLQSQVGLTPGTSGGLYEWAGGMLTFLGESGETRSADKGFHSVSSDGSRVVFSAGPEGKNGLFMRDIARGEAIQLDSAEPACLSKGCVGGGGGFRVASADGSRVLFTDTHKLTANAGAQQLNSKGANDPRPDLYECDVVVEADKLHCNLVDLTPRTLSTESANVGGVLGASSDGSWVYFSAGGSLAEGESVVPGDCNELADHCNLYVSHKGVTKLIATVSGEDAPDWLKQLSSHTARVSSDGEWLVFMSRMSLTGYDNRDAVSGQFDEEVFSYHATTGALVCVSCNPSGARPHGREYSQISEGNGIVGGDHVWPKDRWIGANVPGWTPYAIETSLHQGRYLSGGLLDGGRVFFNSSDALVAGDVNNSEDVYQWEPVGVGGCTVSTVTFHVGSGGCVGLISSGKSGEESAFLDASESGGDVFFLTSARLVAQDFDTSYDVYDAHECTVGSPCLGASVAQPPACGTGDACKAAPSPQPDIFGLPASGTFSGAGNVVSKHSRSLTRAQRLARALRACRAKRGRGGRRVCEVRARRRYGPVRGAKRSVRRGR